MLQITKIQQALSDLVGWEGETSESGLIIEDAHPLLTQDNIASVMPDGDKTEYLASLKRKGITQAIQTFIQQKSLAQETKTLLSRQMLFMGAGRRQATLINQGKRVGFEIRPTRSLGVTIHIERLGFQCDATEGFTLPLYIYHSSQTEPVYEFKMNVVGGGSFQWMPIGVYLHSEGAWYVCYNQSDLPIGVEAINFTKDWSREPCGTCNKGNAEQWRNRQRYMTISPYMVAEGIDDISKHIYTPTRNYGLNLEISVGCDLTDFIIAQRQVFANVIWLQIAYNTLRTIAMNPNARVNRNQAVATRTDILYELDGNTEGREGGLGKMLKDAYAALCLDTKGIDKVCLSCHNNGVRYSAV